MRYLVLLLLLPLLLPAQAFRKSENRRIQPGMRLETWNGTHPKWGRQYVLLLKARKNHWRLDLAYSLDSLLPTSTFAQRVKAAVAVNGGFFDMKVGGSVTFLQSDGKPINENKPNILEEGNEIGAFAILLYPNGDANLSPTVGSRKHPSMSGAEDAMVTGPLLVWNSQPHSLKKRPFNDLRHPRTAVCLSSKQVWLLTADGRHQEAEGLSLPELTQFLIDQGCPTAINLDGGGSTTMYLEGEGVINHPSDNKKFDREGERRVANILYLRSNRTN